MITVLIPDEKDIKQWIKEALREYFEETSFTPSTAEQTGELLLTRKEIAGFLKISLVTLHDWMKKGLPNHKQQGKVYFMRSEVLDYIMANKLNPKTSGT
jgi:predicted DNA-binding transcriptional regulator AlpA